MKKLLLVFVVSLFSLANFAQDLNKVVTITPALLSCGTIAVQPGFQFKIDKRHSLLTELAIPVSTKTPEDIEKFATFRVSTELKYYPKKAIPGRFLGMQLGVTYRQFIDRDSGSYQHISYSKYATGYASTKINSPVIFFNLKLGREIAQWKYLYMDYFLSAGIRFIPTRFDANRSYDIVYSDEPRRPCTVPDLPRAWTDNKNYFRPGAAIGIRLGWKL